MNALRRSTVINTVPGFGIGLRQKKTADGRSQIHSAEMVSNTSQKSCNMTHRMVFLLLAIQATAALITPFLQVQQSKRCLTSSSQLPVWKDRLGDVKQIEINNEKTKKIYGQQQLSLCQNIISRRGLFCSVVTAATTCSALGPKIALASDTKSDVDAKSPFIAFANNFVQDNELDSSSSESRDNPLENIDWGGPKKRGLNIEQMADAINDGLVENEWFVTGRGRPELFSDNFVFADPQVSLSGYEEYCRAVRRLFDQGTARCELVCCSVTGPNIITLLWRNSGKVDLGALQVDLKPYVITTTLKTDPDDGNLVISQVDEFESDTLGLLLYQLPFLRLLVGSPAPSVDLLKQQCDFYTCKLR